MNEQQQRKQTRLGVVVGTSMKKTVTIEVARPVQHPLYKKIIRRKKKYMAHDEFEKCKVGDLVRIVETRPLSKRKRWKVQEIVGLSPTEKAKQVEDGKDDTSRNKTKSG